MSVFCSYILQIAMLLYGVAATHRFAIQPEDVVTIEGTPVQLRCQVNVTPEGCQNCILHWQFNSSQSAYVVEEDFDPCNGSFTCTLTITNVSRKDEGSYSCILSDKSGINLAISNNAKVAVVSTPRFLQEPQNVNVTKGRLAILKCRIDGVSFDAMYVRWTKDDSEVVISDVSHAKVEDHGRRHHDRYSIIGDNDEVYHLQITKTNQSDTGIFYCSVHLKYSGQLILESRGATLDVLFPPDDSYPSCNTVDSKNSTAGDTLTTECISRGGNGAVRLSWLRNGEEISGTRVDENNYYIRNTWTLTAADNGRNITCIMEGEAVLDRRQCVIGLINMYTKPTITIEPETDRVSVGQSVTFKKSTVPTLTTESRLMQTGLSSAVISLIVTISIFLFAVIILAALIFRYHNIKKTKSYGLSRFHSSPPQHELETVN